MPETFSIKARIYRRGITLKTPKGEYSLIYPQKIWQAYPEKIKNILCDNLTFLLTMNLPFVSPVKAIDYNTSLPFFMPFFFQIVARSIPAATDDYSSSTSESLKKFLNTNFSFKEKPVEIPVYNNGYKFKERAIIPLSFGKDSLLTLALAIELGLEPVCVYINDTVSPKENRFKLKMAEKISEEFGLKMHIVTNQIERLNDFDLWDSEETCLGYTHMVTGFSFILLPFVHFYKARYVLIGNQQDMNFPFKNKDGFKTYPSPDQHAGWTRLKSAAISLMTGGQARVLSIIEPLTNIAIIKILHAHYPEFGKYEISCDSLDASYEHRWCHNCSKCARLSLFKKALGIDIKKTGLKRELFDRKHKNLYTLFDGKEVDMYERSVQAKKQQLLAFYLAFKRGEKGTLIREFEKKFLPLSEKEINLLKKEFFSVYNAYLPSNIGKKLLPLLKRMLRE